ncbi:hypothetical protein GOBAR_DD04809 [Gossypium barbadense]|nr:hypothetical protein GOBAR_DD04809 [Gossypium barbadense]
MVSQTFAADHFFISWALKTARDKFAREISFQSEDKDVSLAKALLYVAAEDETFMVFNREMDACSFLNEGINVCPSSNAREWDSVEQMPLDGKTISEWLSELDAIAKEVEAELVSRDIGCHLVEVLQAVNLVLFELRGFKRSPVLVDSKHSYLHLVLSSGCGSAILLSIIYIEVCRRLGLTIVGSRVGEDFLIWPQTTYPEELFKVTSGHSLFAVVNGRCVEDPRSMASDLTGSSLLGLEIASNRDIVGIALANLIVFVLALRVQEELFTNRSPYVFFFPALHRLLVIVIYKERQGKTSDSSTGRLVPSHPMDLGGRGTSRTLQYYTPTRRLQDL